MGSVRESISLLLGVPSCTPNSSLTHQWREPPVLGCPFSQFEMFDFHLSTISLFVLTICFVHWAVLLVNMKRLVFISRQFGLFVFYNLEDIYLTKKIKRRVEDDGIFCSCSSSVGSSGVCGLDCHCGYGPSPLNKLSVSARSYKVDFDFGLVRSVELVF